MKRCTFPVTINKAIITFLHYTVKEIEYYYIGILETQITIDCNLFSEAKTSMSSKPSNDLTKMWDTGSLEVKISTSVITHGLI